MPWWVARVLVPIALVGAGFGATRPLAALERAGPDPGVDELVAALELDGRNPEHQFSLGVLYRDDVRHHDPEAAREHLERAVALNPWAWRYHGQLARLYLQTGRPEEAVAAARRALELNPRAPGYHWALANTLLASGDREAAVAPLRFALERRRDFGAAALRLLLASGYTRAEIESLWPVDPDSRAELARHLARYDAERDRAARRRGRGGEQRPPRRPGG